MRGLSYKVVLDRIAITESSSKEFCVPPSHSNRRVISLRGVEVHNLKSIDLDIAHRQLVVICGLSGSGKTSLALDTLYAEGQRRYIESFSAYTRQFLERLEKPAAEKITGIPPSIAVTHKNTSRSSRSTVGTTTETHDYLRLLYAKIGQVFCLECGREVRPENAESTSHVLAKLPEGARFVVAIPVTLDEAPLSETLASFREEGFVRAVWNDRWLQLDDPAAVAALEAEPNRPTEIDIVVDRLAAGGAADRLRDSLESAFGRGAGRASIWLDRPGALAEVSAGRAEPRELDGQTWHRYVFSSAMRCDGCGREYPTPEPRLFSFNSPLGACPHCEGFGNVIDIDMDLVVPDTNKSIRDGAVAPWNSPAYEHELKELLALAPDVKLPVDVPFRELSEEHLKIIRSGSPKHKFGGLDGFFSWLEKRKYKMHLRVFLSRWRSYRVCPECKGARLRPEALAVLVAGRNIAEVSALRINLALDFFRSLELSAWQREVGKMMLDQVQARLGFLAAVGLDYLSLDRTLRTLSGGEAQRVALTSALGSSLVNMLYVLDEPSAGLHPADIDRLVAAIRSLRDRGNTVVVVEHEESILQAADEVIEIGPGAGERGGEVIYQGPLEGITECQRSSTGDFLAGRRGVTGPRTRRRCDHGWIRLAGARGNNLKNITVEFPLGVMCLVTGVSGSGKSTLIEDTLYPALRRRMRLEATKPSPYDDIYGDGQLEDCILVDQSPIGRSPRSNPVTYIKAFDEIRALFADTLEARTRNFGAGHFSFNSEEGRCPTCEGDGHIAIDMQFLADVYMKCSQCNGSRYRREILEIKYRGRSIADVLQMTVREAFTFFRGAIKTQARLKRLIDVGLDYLRLGQPANTLSGGEAQRLKLAGYMSAAKRSRTLFIFDEPTTGLHFADVVQLLDCFEALLSVGHSLIVVEHNLQMMKAADFIVDLGPGAGDMGGKVVGRGTPEEIARIHSATGRLLAQAMARDARLLAEVAD